jgi:hypothetical protein
MVVAIGTAVAFGMAVAFGKEMASANKMSERMAVAIGNDVVVDRLADQRSEKWQLLLE